MEYLQNYRLSNPLWGCEMSAFTVGEAAEIYNLLNKRGREVEPRDFDNSGVNEIPEILVTILESSTFEKENGGRKTLIGRMVDEDGRYYVVEVTTWENEYRDGGWYPYIGTRGASSSHYELYDKKECDEMVKEFIVKASENLNSKDRYV